MNFFTLKYFIDTFENRNFSRAAKLNYVTQTAISQQIAKLEDELNVTLFDRTKKPIVPTIEAETLYKDAKQLLNQYQKMIDNLEIIKQKPVRFGYAMHAQANYLIQVFAGIPMSLIDFPIMFIPNESGSPIDALLQNEVDIVSAPFEDAKTLPSSFHRKLFYSGKMLLAINKQDLLASKEHVYMKDLEDRTILTLKSSERELINELAAIKISFDLLKLKFKACGENYSSLLLSVLLNEGFCFVPEYFSKELYAENIIFRHIEDDPREIKLAICWRDNHDQQIKKIIQLLTADKTQLPIV